MKHLSLIICFVSLISASYSQNFHDDVCTTYFKSKNETNSQRIYERVSGLTQIDSSIYFKKSSNIWVPLSKTLFKYHSSSLLKSAQVKYFDGTNYVDDYTIDYSWDSLKRMKQVYCEIHGNGSNDRRLTLDTYDYAKNGDLCL